MVVTVASACREGWPDADRRTGRAMTITFEELCQILASAKSVRPDFWKEDPLYIEVGKYIERQASETEPYSVSGSPDLAIDVNAEGEALGIEFLPV
jgi:hypothetical protein